MTDILNASDSPEGLDTKWLEVLVCPLSRTKLRYDADNRELVSDAAGLAFPVRGGVPVMILDEAREISAAD